MNKHWYDAASNNTQDEQHAAGARFTQRFAGTVETFASNELINEQRIPFRKQYIY